MKKRAMITALFISMLLYGCGDKNTEDRNEGLTETNEYVNREDITENETIGSEIPANDTNEISEENSESAEPIKVVQGGPYGQFSLSVPEGWEAETCPVDSDSLAYGVYGIHFYPEGVDKGYVELAYIDFFGVCGTGLSEEEAVIAGKDAYVGTYDNHKYWDFISFQDEHIVALTYSVDEWWDEYGSQVLDIINTMTFDETVKEGGAYVYSEECQISEIGLQFLVENISNKGVVLVFNQYDGEAPDGELMFGEDFVIEKLNGGKWEELPVVVEGKYAFNAVGYAIEVESETKKELDWEWLYGELLPGEYRIKKEVHDFRGSGDFDKYTVYARFILS